MNDADWAALAQARYLSLESYRRDGTPVRTPLWFAAMPATGALVAYTDADSAKVKRLRRTPRCRVASCTMRGTLTGPWLAAQASLGAGDGAAPGMALLNRKYRPWKQVLDLLIRLRPARGRTLITLRRA